MFPLFFSITDGTVACCWRPSLSHARDRPPGGRCVLAVDATGGGAMNFYRRSIAKANVSSKNILLGETDVSRAVIQTWPLILDMLHTGCPVPVLSRSSRSSCRRRRSFSTTTSTRSSHPAPCKVSIIFKTLVAYTFLFLILR